MKKILKKMKDFFKKKNKKNKLLISMIILLSVWSIVLSLSLLIQNDISIEKVPYTQFIEHVEDDMVKTVKINLKSPKFIYQDKEDVIYETDNPKKENFKEYLLTNDIEVIEDEAKSVYISEIFNTLRLILLSVFMFFILKSAMPRQRNDEVTNDIPNITFDDIAGCKEVKKDMQFVVDFLKNPKRYHEMGARMPKGVVLYGPPGTGKTLTAKAIAGTAGVPFFSVSGSDFMEMYVGLGAKRVRDLYKQARKKAPCIIFIDEIDAVGSHRGGMGSHSEKDQTINALLAELDGFSGSEGIITICATNRLEELDKALIRPGRFDKHIAIPLPERDDRLQIIKVHARNKKISDLVNFNEIASMTVGFSGADLEALLNESAFIAVNEGRDAITPDDIDTAFYRLVMKGDRKENQSSRDKKELELVAWHEAGHALATKLLTDDEVPKVTIISSTSGAGGVTFRTPKEVGIISKSYLRNLIKIMYAGRVAEYIFLGDEEKITTGAGNDIKQATALIKQYITTYGMSDKFGLINLEEFSRNSVSVGSNELLLKEASDLSKELYNEVLDTLEKNKDLLEKIAKELLAKESLSGTELDKLMSNHVKNIRK